jgi:hypothetical protein
MIANPTAKRGGAKKHDAAAMPNTNTAKYLSTLHSRFGVNDGFQLLRAGVYRKHKLAAARLRSMPPLIAQLANVGELCLKRGVLAL